MSFTAVDDKILKEAGVQDPITVYNKIANIGGFGVSGDFRPILDLSGMPAELKAQADKVIAEAMPKAQPKFQKENE